jgi:hypothetical protein
MKHYQMLKLVIATSVFPLLVASMAFPLITGLPNICMEIDLAMIELYTRNAMEGNQSVGMYSRFGWNHLGPIYFYLLTPIYVLAKQSASSLLWAALLINTACALLLFLIIFNTGKKDVVFAKCASILLAFLFLYVGIVRLASPWPPWAIVLPFALFMQTTAVFAEGRTSYFPAILVLGSLIIQIHIGTGPTVLFMTGIACVLCALACRTWYLDVRNIVLGFAALCAMWFLPLMEQINGEPGNLSKVLAFFTQSSHSASLTDSVYAVAIPITWFPLGILRKFVLDIPAFEFELLSVILAFAQVAGLIVVFIVTTRREANLRSKTAMIGIVAVLSALWSASRIEGDIFGYLLFWVSSIGFLNSALIMTEVYEYLGMRTWCSIPRTQIAVLSISIFLAIVSTSLFLKCPLPEDSVKIRMLSEALITHLKDNGIKRPVFLFNWGHWTTDSAIILQLHKRNISFAARNLYEHHGSNWPLLLGRNYRPSVEDNYYVFVEKYSTADRPGYHQVAAFGDTRLLVKKE